MDKNIFEILQLVDSAVDDAFLKRNLKLNFYLYIKEHKYTKKEIEEFLESPSVKNIHNTIDDLNEYANGGNDDIHKQLREAYGHISKPDARKIKNYLKSILDDSQKYKNEKRKKRTK